MFLIWNSENSYLLAVVRIKCDKPSAGVGEYSQAVGKLLHQGGHAGEGEDGQHSKWKLGRVRKKGLKGPASEHSEEGRNRPGLQSPLLHCATLGKSPNHSEPVSPHPLLPLCVLVSQLCLTLWNPTNDSLPGFSVHGISQAKINSVQSVSRVRLFVTPWTAAHQASLSITNSRSLLKLMSIDSVMPS